MKLRYFILFVFVLVLWSCSARNNEDYEVSLLFLGDTSFGENYQKYWDENFLQTKGYDYSLHNYKKILVSADLVVANLETPLTALKNSRLSRVKKYIHYSNPEYSPETFKQYNMTVFSLANNHLMDYGLEGLRDTYEALENYELVGFAGGETEEDIFAPYMGHVEKNSVEFDFAVISGFEYYQDYDYRYEFYGNAERPGIPELSEEFVKNTISSLRKENPDIFIIIFPHWGSNYKMETERQRRLAYSFIDNGADLVVGHGSHILQNLESYEGKWIVYSLGNFVFNSPGRYKKYDVPPFSAIARILVSENEIVLRLYPIVTDNLSTNYQGRFVTKKEMKQVHEITGLKSFSERDYYGEYYELPLREN